MKRQRGAAGLAIAALNAFVTPQLFHVKYTGQMGSIEAAFISLARYIGAHFGHFGHLGWFPLWYGGIPFANAYPPLLHFLVAGVAAVGRVPAGLAYHAVTVTLYALGPVTLFWLALRLGSGTAPAFAAAWCYSLVSPSCWLVREVRADTGGWWGARRLATMVRYGEGPHIAALVFLPLAIGLVHVALKKRRPHYYVLAALGLAAVALSNWIGAFALGMALPAYLLAGFPGARVSAWARTGAVCVYAYAMALPWVTPSTVAAIRTNAPKLVGFKASSGHVWLVAALGAGLVLLAWSGAKLRLPPGARFGVLLLYGPAVITLGAYWFRMDLLPQAQRYHLEMDLAFWLLMGLAAAGAKAAPRGGRAAAAAVGLLVLASIPVAIHQQSQAREWERPVAIESTAEYKISKWLGQHMPSQRVFAPGSVGFWMDAFSDTPLLSGGFDNGIRNENLWKVNYQILAGDQQSTAVDWLKAYGCDAIVGGDPQSGEVFHPYAHPEKLHGLPEMWRDGAEVIYAVPGGSRSLAHALRAGDLVTVTPPGYDTRGMAPYLAALGDATLPAADFRWRDGDASTGEASITADLKPEHVLSVQITYDEGWTARAGGRPIAVGSDKLGQIVLAPECNGPCRVDLIYTGGAEAGFARWTSRAALAGGAGWMVLAGLWRKRRDAAGSG